MRRRVAALVVGALGASLALGGVAWAKPMDPVNDTWDYVKAGMDFAGGDSAYFSGPPLVAQAFIDANAFLGSSMQATRGWDFTGDPFADTRCTDINKEPCASANKVQVTVVLPLCSASRSRDCVESLYLRTASGVEEAQQAGEWHDAGGFEFASVPTTIGPTPASGRLPLFRLPTTPHSGGDLYAASVQVDVALVREGGQWTASRSELGAQIFGVSRTPRPGGGGLCPTSAGLGQGADASNCLRINHVLPDADMGIRARVSPTFGSWIFGRVAEPNIVVKPMGDQITLDVSGHPSVTPQSLAIVTPQEATPGMILWMKPYERGVRMVSFSAGQVGSLNLWSAWNAATKSTAASLKRLWLFRASSAGSFGASSCIKAGEIAGWVSTNAMVYEAQPPALDAATGALDFKIGGPALQPDGSSLVSADYELFLRTDVASCVWPNQAVAKVATVSVIDGAGGEEATSTSVSESGGWVKFVAKNVLFPSSVGSRTRADVANPTVRVMVPKTTAETFGSCTLMRKKYKDGVTYTGAINTVTVNGKKIIKAALGKPFVSDAVYTINAKLDTDKDSLACEREPKVR